MNSLLYLGASELLVVDTHKIWIRSRVSDFPNDIGEWPKAGGRCLKSGTSVVLTPGFDSEDDWGKKNQQNKQ